MNTPSEQEKKKHLSLHYLPFAAGEDIYCVWDWNLDRTNMDFLDGVDPDYFSFLAETYRKEVEGRNKHRAAVALRTAYHQALETLFSLIFAAMQAPDCIPAWIIKCNKAGQLRHLIKSVSEKKQTVLLRANLSEFSWEGIAKFIIGYLFKASEERPTQINITAKLWARLANDFLDDFLLAEYNSIKHGFRVRLGGMQFSFSPKGTKDEKPPDSSYIPIGTSKVGAFFFVGDRIANAPTKKPDLHFRLKRCHVNSHPEFTAQALFLVAQSIRNVASFLKAVNGQKKFQVFTFKKENVVEETWKKQSGLKHFTEDRGVDEQHITRFTREELLAFLHSPNDIEKK
jgi:hypothetical protein